MKLGVRNIRGPNGPFLPSKWSFLHNFENQGVARIFLLWNSLTLRVLPVGISPQSITVLAQMSSCQESFYVSVVYGSNSPTVRRSSWSDLRNLKYMVDDKPWIILGDFNVVGHFSQRMDGIVGIQVQLVILTIVSMILMLLKLLPKVPGLHGLVSRMVWEARKAGWIGSALIRNGWSCFQILKLWPFILVFLLIIVCLLCPFLKTMS